MPGRIIVETVELEAPFAQVPSYLLLDTELSAGGFKTYAALLWCVWERERKGLPGYEGYRKFAEQFGMSPRSVMRYLNELCQRGYIDMRRPEGAGRDEPGDIIIRNLSTVREQHRSMALDVVPD